MEISTGLNFIAIKNTSAALLPIRATIESQDINVGDWSARCASCAQALLAREAIGSSAAAFLTVRLSPWALRSRSRPADAHPNSCTLSLTQHQPASQLHSRAPHRVRYLRASTPKGCLRFWFEVTQIRHFRHTLKRLAEPLER